MAVLEAPPCNPHLLTHAQPRCPSPCLTRGSLQAGTGRGAARPPGASAAAAAAPASAAARARAAAVAAAAVEAAWAEPPARCLLLRPPMAPRARSGCGTGRGPGAGRKGRGRRRSGEERSGAGSAEDGGRLRGRALQRVRGGAGGRQGKGGGC